MIAIETRIADLQDALDNPEPDAYDTPDELRRAIRALQRLAAATPWDVLAARHLDAIGGPSVLVSIVAGDAADAADEALDRITEANINAWLNGIRSYVDRKEQEVVEEHQTWVRREMSALLSARLV